ncbi:uncharacterized protein LOC117332525 [Pecten maximus]|uniref:uncharacterized protein LOC117332525 n=1 Tax=Pecten maximus TaxID=6579 RepID=UPI0014585CEB|nr:uncharacterized protein LOC117332525 [Pecten maximus]
MTRQSDDPIDSQPSEPEFEGTQQSIHTETESNKENENSEQAPASGSDSNELSRGRKRSKSETEDHSQPAGGKRATVCQTDQGSRMFFNVNNDIDITRQASQKDISDTFTRVTRQSRHLRKAKLKKKCIQVCLDITAARSASEPSSLHLAEEFKHYLLEGGTIQLTDESQTVLQIVKDSFEITPETTPEDGSPYVNISHSQFTVPVGKTAIIQTYVISSPEVTSIQWFKKEDDEDIPIEFDNKQYFGGSILSPTLIIRKTTIGDHGQYLCTATNCNGTGLSNMTVLSLQSDGNETEALTDKKVSIPARMTDRTFCFYHKGKQIELYCT